MIIELFFIMSPRGDTIISRGFCGTDSARVIAQKFFEHITEREDPLDDHHGSTSGTSSSEAQSSDKSLDSLSFKDEVVLPSVAAPIFLIDNISYLYLFTSGLYFVATTSSNISPCFVLELLDRYSRLFKDYLGELHEDSVRKNSVLLYELLDEALDWGFPQNTSTDSLKGYVQSEPVITRRIDLSEKLQQFVINQKTKSTTATTRPVAMTFSKDRNQKNEFFVDLLERVTAIIAGSGAIVRAEVDGCLVMKSYLKGEPVVHLGLSDRDINNPSRPPIVFQDVNFHHDIGPQDFEHTRMLRFAPPAGEFIALNYRLTSDVRLPFRVFPFIEGSTKHNNQIAIIVKIFADFSSSLIATDVSVSIPVPKASISISSELGYAATSMGERAELYKNQQLYIWSIPNFVGQTEHILKATIFLNHPYVASTFKEIGPISLAFEIPMYTCSGLEIKQLKIIEQTESYEVARWIRYITQSRSYIARPL